MKCNKCGFDDDATRGDVMCVLAESALDEGLDANEWLAGCAAVYVQVKAVRARDARVSRFRGKAIALALDLQHGPPGKGSTPTS